jgi:cell division protein FtsL
MTAWAPAAEASAAPIVRRRRRPRPAPKRRTTHQRSFAGGVAWIALVAVLLAGIVALNVAVLRLNMQLEELGRERAELRAKNAELASRISSSAATPRIGALARDRLGLVEADPSETLYIDLSRAR